MFEIHFRVTPSGEYGAKGKFEGQSIESFSPNYLKSAYPQGGCRVLGEIGGGKNKKSIGTVQVGQEQFSVAPCGSYRRLLWRPAGYLKVGKDEYLALMKSRLPFLGSLLFLLAAICIMLVLLLAGNDQRPNAGDDEPNPGEDTVVIAPDHPLPPEDKNAVPIEGDNSEKTKVEEGGGALSMIYKLDCTIDLSNGDIGIYFKNPNASSHEVTVDMYIVSGGEAYLVAQSGILKAGYALERLQLLPDAPTLGEGVYAGLFRFHCYDPVTGEQAMVVPEVAGLNITVTD